MNMRRALKRPMGKNAATVKKKGVKAKSSEPSATLFTWIDALYTKAKPEGSPPMYVVHRFLASDQQLAQWARVIQQQVREAPLMFRVWQGLLPIAVKAPWFQYAAAKKLPQEEDLVARMEIVLGENRRNVESMLELVIAAGREAELYREFGITPPAP